MPLHEPLLKAMRERQFWTDWFFLTDAHLGDYSAICNREEPSRDSTRRHHQIDFALPDSFGLSLDVSEGLGYFNLDLVAPDGSKTTLGWDDQAHWHPHALRWEELDAFCRYIALTDPTLPHPGPLLIVSRFAPLCHGEDSDHVFSLMQSAWRTLNGLLSPTERREVLDRIERRQEGFRWRFDEDIGWTLYQDDPNRWTLYTLRQRDSEFPFAALQEVYVTTRRALREFVHPSWLRGEATLRVANALAAEGDVDAAPVLADALEEAGCRHPTILAALRPPLDPPRVWWIIDLLLDLELGSVIARHFQPRGAV